MNKGELVNAIAEKAGLTKADATRALDAFIATVEDDVVAKGESLTLVGFGTFSVKERSAREGRNPRTGETIKIAAKKIVSFKPGSALSDKAN